MSYQKISIADILRAIKYKPETQGLIMHWLSPRELQADERCHV